jgi:hypothetical protein
MAKLSPGEISRIFSNLFGSRTIIVGVRPKRINNPTPRARMKKSSLGLPIRRSIAISAGALAMLANIAYAANPFLDAPDDRPVSAKFRGTEWGDNIDEEEIPLSANVVTTRMAEMPWGSIFKIEFNDLSSKRKERREIRPEYLIVTDDRIMLLNKSDMAEAVRRIAAMDDAPEFEPGDVYGITEGKFKHDSGNWKTTIETKGDQCTYLSSHDSGHFKKLVWKKGVGLVEHSAGYGARQDGYRLKRVSTKAR